jgi:dTDP-4-amino-4,6-dideoxygalactose transaminase
MNPRYYHSVVGINGRLDSIQAAVLNVKIRQLSKWSEQRQANAARYGSLMQTTGIDQWLTLPADLSNSVHVWNQFTVRVPGGRRDDLKNYLGEANIGSEIYYPVPLHRQECFASLGYEEGSLPETERAAAEVLSLPIFPELKIAEQQAVVDQIAKYQRALGSAAA